MTTAIIPEVRARTWIDTWNSRDLERILAMYADQCEMASPHISALGLAASGSLAGKDRLREYWRIGLARAPNLRFDLISIYAGADSIVLHYRNDRGREICEFLRYGADGLIVQGSANHMPGTH